MKKYSANDITMIRVTEQDPALEHNIPQIGIEQGVSHDTRLPNKPEYMPKIAENFRNAMKHVQIWRVENPAIACGAVFLSPLTKNGQKGLQIDDVVVMPEYRGKNIGSALIQFTAALAKSRGLSFVTWECEENNPAQNMYRKVNATPRENVKPFRLTRDIIVKAIEECQEKPASDDVTFSVSNRFSLFRTINHGIDGYDMDPTQKSLGLQIEDLKFDTVANARHAIISVLKKYRDQSGIDFVDIIIPTDSAKHLELIAGFDAAQNTYSGNPAFLWELNGQAFEQAAEIGKAVKVQYEATNYNSSQLNAKTSSITG